MAAILAVASEADSFVDVPTILSSLFSDNGIDSTNILGIQITPFGANKFLVTVTYS